ncbi:MAG: hypothetical protein OXG80_00100 [Chloroflexi bacterium]|nr:hypothetical protein [Chloroflexota bacterium]
MNTNETDRTHEAEESPEPHPRVEQIMTVLRQRYGDRLSQDEFDEVGEAAKAIVQASEDMRAVELGHGDSPFSVPPYRKD